MPQRQVTLRMKRSSCLLRPLRARPTEQEGVDHAHEAHVPSVWTFRQPERDGLKAATKYVVTRRPESLEWGPFEGLGPDFVEGVRRIKSQDGPGLVAGPLKTG